jgi:hypothetical protein
MFQCCASVIPSNSARVFDDPAEILRHSSVEQLLSACGRGHVVEYGPGCLRNALYLQRKQFNVSVIELGATRDRFKQSYRTFAKNGGRFIEWDTTNGGPGVSPLNHAPKPDIAVITFVLETICQPRLREIILADCRKRIKADGTLILSIRGAPDVVTAHAKGRKCSDGFVTPLRTFIKPFTVLEVQKLLANANFHDAQFLHRPTTKSPKLIHVLARTK